VGNAATTPLIVGDTIYVQTLSSDVLAIDRTTGKVRWTKTYSLPQIGPNGVALGWGKVFVAKGSHAIAALDATTGRELWARSIGTTATQGVDIQPQVFDGLVYASTVPVSIEGIYQGGDRGTLYALGAASGKVVWTFDTIQSKNLWGHPDINSGGGAWYPPSVDPTSNSIFWGIANPAPFPGTPKYPNGSSRPGPNLYTDSVVTLDAHTGKLRWYHQATPHDLFDRDLVLNTLVDMQQSGKHRDVLVATGKAGRLIGLDPTNGKELWDTPVGRHHNDDLNALSGPTEIYPGTFGGVITPPAAADGVVYAAVLNAPTTLSPDKASYIGSELGTAPGEVDAVDASTGDVRWTTKIDGDPLGGTLVVDDLVFTGTYQGTLYALDRGTGKIVWQMKAPGGLNGWPAASGDQIVWPIGLSDPPVLLALGLSD
jgi:glucose dehydrogenase